MRAFWRRRGEPWQRPPAPAEVTLQAIGYVRNDTTKPRPHGWEKVESKLEFLADHAPKLAGIGAYSHLIVVTYLDVAAGAPEEPDTITLASGDTYGILATRSQLRPNHLGVSVVELLAHEGSALRVRGLDSIDGTPILDIKPYLPEYDSRASSTTPH